MQAKFYLIQTKWADPNRFEQTKFACRSTYIQNKFEPYHSLSKPTANQFKNLIYFIFNRSVCLLISSTRSGTSARVRQALRHGAPQCALRQLRTLQWRSGSPVPTCAVESVLATGGHNLDLKQNHLKQNQMIKQQPTFFPPWLTMHSSQTKQTKQSMLSKFASYKHFQACGHLQSYASFTTLHFWQLVLPDDGVHLVKSNASVCIQLFCIDLPWIPSAQYIQWRSSGSDFLSIFRRSIPASSGSLTARLASRLFRHLRILKL